MSSHATPSAHCSLVLLGVLAACATTTSKIDRQKLTADHVYLGTRDELAAGVTRVFAERRLKLVQAAPDTLQTPWVALNVPQTVGGSLEVPERTTASVLYECRRVTLIEIDPTHHRLRVERGTATSLLTADNAQRVNPSAEQGAATSPGGGGVVQLAPPPGTTTPEFVQDDELEWALVQGLDPTGAGAIAHEEAVVNRSMEAPAPSPPAPPPPAVREVARGCPDVPGIDPLLEAHRLVLLGELQGSEQAPQFLGAVACRTSALGIPLAVGLELPRQGNAALEAYLASAGTAADRQAYLDTDTWQRDWQDGRSSKAVFALIEQLRALRKAGADIQLAGIDDRRWIGQARDKAMAEQIESMRRKALDRPMVVLVGNLHASTASGNVAQGYVPLGARLESFGLRPMPLVMAYDKGTIWGCTPGQSLGCGVHPVRSWPPGERTTAEERFVQQAMGKAPPPGFLPRSVHLWKARAEGFDGVFYVGPVTASRPARGTPAGH